MELNCKISNPPKYTFDKPFGRGDNYKNYVGSSEVFERKTENGMSAHNDDKSNNKVVDLLSMIMKDNLHHLEIFKAKHFPVSYQCRAENAIKIFFGWSVGANIRELSEYLSISSDVTRHFYFLSTLYAKRYIRDNMEDWRMGGPGIVVLLDMYPGGCSKFNFTTSNNRHSVLCIAETKSIPQKFWFQILNQTQPNQRNEEIFKVITAIVRPNSILVMDLNSISISELTRRRLKSIYQMVVNLDSLERHNTENQLLLDNLETIWKPALDICEFGNYQGDVTSYYTSYLWNQRFGNDNLSMLLNQF